MNKKYLFFPLAAIVLASCSKTNLLYDENAYNSPIFDENYYTNREDIDSLEIAETINPFILYTSEDGIDSVTRDGFNPNGFVWHNPFEKEKEFGYNNNLDKIEKKFNYGILSKLYDGRVRCEGYYQKSRVQLNKTGYATYFPKSLVQTKYIAFACRGGTTLANPLGFGPNRESEFDSGGQLNPKYSKRALDVNFTFSFYIHIINSNAYNKVTYKLNNVNVQCDNGGSTNLVYFPIFDDALNGAIAMSLEWSCEDPRLLEYNLTDNYTDKEKDHLAIMLYEVFLGDSIWY